MDTFARYSWTCLLGAALSIGSLWPAAATELAEPQTLKDEVNAPPFRPDPTRPADAPTDTAIQSASAEDGAEAGLVLAVRALNSSRVAYGAKDSRTIVPLTNQANAKQRAGYAAAALVDYQTALELAEATGGPRDAHLFDAWYGIGYMHHAAGHDVHAAAAFATALQLHRVNQGLYSRAQLDVLHALALTSQGAGRTEDADEFQIRRIVMAQRLRDAAPDTGDTVLTETYTSVGRWFRNTGRIDDAIRLHGLALGLVERRNGKQNPELIGPLLEVAATGGLRRREMDQASLPASWQPPIALARAERLADARKNVLPAEQAQTLIRIADVHMSQGRREPALRNYSRATQILAGLGQKAPFAEPAFLMFRPPQPAPVSGPGGFVVAEFDVSEEGRAKEIRIIETQPSNLPKSITSDLAVALRAARLRPVIRAGKPAASKGMRYRLPVRSDSG